MNKSKDATDKVPEFDEELYFAKEPKAFIPKVIEEIIVRRSSIKSEIKAAKTIEEKLLLEARSYNLKILANSMYGYLSFVYARWYCKEAGAATTAYARYYIKKTIDAAKEAGFHILYGDTDSLFLELREKTADDAKAFVATYNKTLPGIMMLQFEDEFACGIFVAARGKEGGAKKRYALLSKSGKFKITGFEYVRQDWCDYARNTQREVIELVLKENDPKKAYAYIKGRITALQARQVDMADLIIRDKLSRELNEYQTNLPHVVLARKLVARGESLGRGSRISYVITQGKGNLYEKVALASDVTLDQIDIDYYVSNQVLAVVGSIMEIFGYNTEDILTNKKQGSLNDFF
jgi:DNA polymerase elongation subunit (family B)